MVNFFGLFNLSFNLLQRCAERLNCQTDGFYEWQKTDGGKQPYHVKMEDGSPFAFAGLWETWQDGEEIRSCTIITTDANDLMKEIHHRMPVILPPENYGV